MDIPTGTLAPPPAKVAVRGPAMQDAVAAPVPNRSKPLRKPTHAEATSKLKSGLGGMLFGALIGGALLYFGFNVLGGAALLFCCGGSLSALFGSKEDVSDCAFCGRALHDWPKLDVN